MRANQFRTKTNRHKKRLFDFERRRITYHTFFRYIICTRYLLVRRGQKNVKKCILLLAVLLCMILLRSTTTAMLLCKSMGRQGGRYCWRAGGNLKPRSPMCLLLFINWRSARQMCSRHENRRKSQLPTGSFPPHFPRIFCWWMSRRVHSSARPFFSRHTTPPPKLHLSKYSLGERVRRTGKTFEARSQIRRASEYWSFLSFEVRLNCGRTIRSFQFFSDGRRVLRGV